jgi:AmiR/NasT family two-component response regulator
MSQFVRYTPAGKFLGFMGMVVLPLSIWKLCEIVRVAQNNDREEQRLEDFSIYDKLYKESKNRD